MRNLSNLYINGDLSVDTNILHVDSTNNRVGVGTASPSNEILHVAGNIMMDGSILRMGSSTTKLVLQNVGGAWNSLSAKGINIGDWNSDPQYGDILVGNYDFSIKNDALTSLMRVKNNGNVLIGTTTDSGYKLDVNGTATFRDDVDMRTNYIDFKSNGSSTVPQFFGHRSSTDLDSRDWTSEGGWAYTTFDANSLNAPNSGSGLHNANGLLSFNTHNGDYGHQIAMTTNTNKLHFRTRNAGAWQSWHEITTNSKDFIPATDSTYDIGSSSVRFANGYFDTLYGDGSNLTNIPETDTLATVTTRGNTTTNDITVGDITVNQTSDTQGVKIYGYDDKSAASAHLFVNSGGNTQLVSSNPSSSGYLQIQAQNYLELSAPGLVYTSSRVRIYDAGQLDFGSSGDYKIKYDSVSDILNIHTDTNEGITIGSTGNILIGTTTDSGYKLDVDGNVRAVGTSHTLDAGTYELNVLSSGLTATLGGSTGGDIGGKAATYHLGGVGATLRVGPQYSSDRDYIEIVAGNTDSLLRTHNELLTVKNTGGHVILEPLNNVGVGTVTPSTKLSVSSSGANGIDISADQSNSSISGRLFLSNGTSGQSAVLMNNGGGLAFHTQGTPGSGSGTERMRLTSGGNVGIGTTSPDVALDVQMSTASQGLKIRRHNNSSQYLHLHEADGSAHWISAVGEKWMYIDNQGATYGTIIRTNGNDRVIFTSGGNVLIGTTTDSGYKLQVSGDATINGVRVGRGSGNVDGNTVLGSGAFNSNSTGLQNTAIGYQSLRNNTGLYNTALGFQSAYNNTTGERNTAVGRQALRANSTGSYNVALGMDALNNNTASNNTALGYQAAYSNTSGDIVAIGWQAGFSNTTGLKLTAIGRESLRNATGNENTAVGYRAAYNTTTGIHNTALGQQSLLDNTTGSRNTSIGSAALENNTASNNTALGFTAGYSNTTGSIVAVGYQAGFNNLNGSITAIGYDSMYNNTSGTDNTSVGNSAMFNNTTGNNNTAVGREALLSNTIGISNVAIGEGSARTSSTKSFVVAIGREALRANDTSSNTAVGYRAAYSNTTGNLVAIGYEAGYSSTTAGQITAIGFQALRNSTGANNTAIGYQALLQNTSGSHNVGIGREALFSNTTGTNNIAIGSQSLLNNTSSFNTAIGYQAGYSNTSGNSNTSVGYQALKSNSTSSGNAAFGMYSLLNNTGADNTAIGQNAGRYNTTGSNNIFIGQDSDGVAATDSNRTFIGNSSTTSTWVGGNLLVGTTTNSGATVHIRQNSSGQSPINSPSLFIENNGSSNSYYALQVATQGGGYCFNVTNAGNVGIGTTSPSYALDIERTTGEVAIQLQARDNSSNTAIYFGDNDDADVGSLIYNQGSNYMSFTTNAGEKMRIASDGKVGIGTSSPSHKVDIYSNENVPLRIHRPSNANLNSSGAWGIGFSTRGDANTSTTDTRAGIFSYYNGNLFLAAANTSIVADPDAYARLTVTSGGYIGLGTMSPARPLHVSSAATSIIADFEYTAASYSTIQLTNTGGNAHVSSVNSDLLLSPGTTERMRVKSNGNVLIGTTTDSGYKLNVNGTFKSNALWTDGSANAYWGNGGASTAYGLLTWDTSLAKVIATSGNRLDLGANGSTFATIATSGNVGIGTTNPSYNLDVQGTTNGIIRAYGGSIGRLSLQNSTRHYSLSVQGSSFYLYDEVGAATRMLIDSSGNVGIGTTSPGTELEIGDGTGSPAITLNKATTGTATLFFDNGGNNKNWIKADSAESLVFATNNTANVIIKEGGNVGIGTTSPGAKLQISSGNNVDTQLLVGEGSTYGAPSIRFKTASTNYMGIGFTTGSVVGNEVLDAIAIQRTGNVGIGTTSPSDRLHIVGSNGSLRIDNTSSTKSFSMTVMDSNNRFRIYDNTSSAERLTITSGGNVGIGTTSPSTALDVGNGQISGVDVLYGDSSGSLLLAGYDKSSLASSFIGFYTANGTASGERMRIDSAGNVGIGGSPASVTHGPHLDIVGTRGTLTVGTGYFEDNGTTNFLNGARPLAFGYAGSEYMRIHSSGNVGIGTTSPLGKLHVENSAVRSSVNGGSDNIVIEENGYSGITILSSRDNAGQIHFGDQDAENIGMLQYFHSDNSMRFTTNATERMRITSSGLVGIGTSSPGAKVHIGSSTLLSGYTPTTTTLAISDTTNGAELILRGQSPRIWFDATASGSGEIYMDGTNLTILSGNPTSVGSSRLYINSSGNVGIGTTSPTSKTHVYYGGGTTNGLHVQASANRGKIAVSDNDTAAYMIAENSLASFGRQDALSANNLNITSGGNVLIGTTTDNGKKLQVNGDVFIKGSNSSSTYANAIFEVQNSNGTSIMDFRGDAYAFFGCGQGGGAASGFIFRYNDTSHVQFTGYNYGNGAGSYKPILLDTDLVGRGQGIYVNFGGTGYANPAPLSTTEFAVRGRTSDSSENAMELRDSNNTEKFVVRNDGAITTNGNQGWSGTVSCPSNPVGQRNLEFTNGILTNVF